MISHLNSVNHMDDSSCSTSLAIAHERGIGALNGKAYVY